MKKVIACYVWYLVESAIHKVLDITIIIKRHESEVQFNPALNIVKPLTNSPFNILN